MQNVFASRSNSSGFGRAKSGNSAKRGGEPGPRLEVQNVEIFAKIRENPKFSIRKLYSNPVSHGVRECLRAVPITIWVV